jgi:hypothetical protein
MNVHYTLSHTHRYIAGQEKPKQTSKQNRLLNWKAEALDHNNIQIFLLRKGVKVGGGAGRRNRRNKCEIHCLYILDKKEDIRRF